MQFINTSNSATLIYPWSKNFCDSRSKLTSTSDKLSPCTLWTVHAHDNDDGKCILLMDGCCQFFVSPNPSWQILVPRTSPSNVPRTSPKDPIWQSRGRPNWRPRDVLIWRPPDVSKWHPGDVLIWRSRDVPERLIWEVSGRSQDVP